MMFRGNSDVYRGDVYRGDVFYVDKFGNHGGGYPYVLDGSKQDRPCVVVSSDDLNRKLDVVEVVYLSSKDNIQDLPTHAKVLASVPSTAICEQITTVAKERLRDFVRKCTADEMQQIDAAIMASLGLQWNDRPLANAHETIDHMQTAIHEKDAEIEKLKKECDLLFEAAHPAPAPVNADVVKLTVERDMYKAQYEMLLNKLIG